jgi:hypothetical protein
LCRFRGREKALVPLFGDMCAQDPLNRNASLLGCHGTLTTYSGASEYFDSV